MTCWLLVGEALHKTEAAPLGARDVVDGDYPKQSKEYDISCLVTHQSTCAVYCRQV
jgi:hypothetical protein